ncbi:amino acid permease/ SLC12A domain-containing protein [Auriculariales sp. MPI-PUGE-AT-0066]|nr:amino acid permease/ SLC12A domain-containing protein [Auriculariales sp. MPI-PUGE-AT-0066]
MAEVKDSASASGSVEKLSDRDSVASVAAAPTWYKRWFAVTGGEGTTRGLSQKHLVMIAIGGTIGTGIFLSAGSAVAQAGPGGALIAYSIVGLFVYAVVICIGEMSAYIPVSGSFSNFAERFVSPSLGWTLGWAYWLGWALSIPSELIAASVILQFWTTTVPSWGWALVLIVPIFAMQLIHVRVFGESEAWFALIKVLLVVLFIFFGLLYDWGAFDKVAAEPGPGLENFHHGQAFVGGFPLFAQTFAYAFFSYGGIELVTLAAGESAQPEKAIPRAVKSTFLRILIFYLLTVLTIGLCINNADPTLLTAAFDSDVTASPLTVTFQRMGFGGAAHAVNAVLLTAVLSATNSCFYGSSRMLLALAKQGHAPAFFARTNSRGVPVPALLASLAVSFVAFLTSIWGAGVVFTWLLNLAGINALLVWMSCGIISIRFRLALRAQNRALSDLPFLQPLYPLLPAFVLLLGTLMFIAQGYAAVAIQPFEARNVVATYVGIATFVVLYVGYTLYERFVLRRTRHFVELEKADLDTDAVWGPGRERRDVEETTVNKPTQEPLWRRAARHVY